MLMVQTNSQSMKPTKIKGPPPVPPRPSQSMVAEALAKTRKAVADSKASLTKSKTYTKNEVRLISSKAKTLDRNTTTSKPSVSPRQNGLARVKSFIKDVISDRSSSSDERKSSGTNSRRSSSDSSSIQSPASNKKSNESLNSKAVKTCKQILVRSLSTSNKLDQDSKCKVSKSSSFAEKTLPLRKAPPPPLSPKPKLKPMKQLHVQKSLDRPLPRHTSLQDTPKHRSLEETPKHRSLEEPMRQNSLERYRGIKDSEITTYSLPIDAKTKKTLQQESHYASVDEIQSVEERVENIDCNANNNAIDINSFTNPPPEEDTNKNTNSLERKTSRVTEMLISEILASRNNNVEEPNTVIDKGKNIDNFLNVNGTFEIEKMKDMNNHEMLIYELQTMRSQSNVPDNIDNIVMNENTDIPQMHCDSDSEQNYLISSLTSENTDEFYEQPYAYIQDVDLKSRLQKQFKAISTMSLQGLPPLPKSLSGFTDTEAELQESPNTPVVDENPPTDLDSQLVYLKKEMASLRQLDLSLLSELWTLSERMASWRRQLERGPRLRPAPPPPPPPPHYLRT